MSAEPIIKSLRQIADEAVMHGEACVAAYTAARRKFDSEVADFDLLQESRKLNLVQYTKDKSNIFNTLVWAGRLRTRHNMLKHKHDNTKRVLAGLAASDPIRSIPREEYIEHLALYKKNADDAYTAYASAASWLGEYIEKPHEA